MQTGREEEEFKKYLPQYLSTEDQNSLLSGLKGFPDNFSKKSYSSRLQSQTMVFQGDGFSQMPHSNLPTNTIREAKSIILSNTCDLSRSNSRLFAPHIIQAPIIELKKYQKLLITLYVDTQKKPIESINAHIKSIREQSVSDLFFLPKTSSIEDSIVQLSRISNLPSNYLSTDKITKNRLFSLSDYGFYVFLYKLSVHFTRIKEGVSRGS